jgi:hypothetical protein
MEEPRVLGEMSQQTLELHRPEGRPFELGDNSPNKLQIVSEKIQPKCEVLGRRRKHVNPILVDADDIPVAHQNWRQNVRHGRSFLREELEEPGVGEPDESVILLKRGPRIIRTTDESFSPSNIDRNFA